LTRRGSPRAGSSSERGRRGRRLLAIEALLLDVDGTLFDSNELHARAWREVLEERGVRVSLARIRPLIGMGGEDLARALLPKRTSAAELEELADRHSELFERRYLRRVREVPGARDFLRECHRRGLRLVLASSGKEDQVEALVRKLKARRWLEGATSADDVRRPKPAPDLFRAALTKFSLPDATAVVGDTPYDVRAGRAAGLPVVAVLSGGFSRSALRGADRIYPRIGDMREDLVWALR
jgi:HAD superfamily hydrolase (TIGR01549 family)